MAPINCGQSLRCKQRALALCSRYKSVSRIFVASPRSMAAYELLSDQGLRLDGRKSGELRRIRCKMGVFGQADGSAYIEQVSQTELTNMFTG